MIHGFLLGVRLPYIITEIPDYHDSCFNRKKCSPDVRHFDSQRSTAWMVDFLDKSSLMYLVIDELRMKLMWLVV